MLYFIEHKDSGTEQKYSCQFQTHDVFEAVETATKVAKVFHEKYSEHYKNNFEENWSEARKNQFFRLNAWAVRVKDDDGKTVLLLNSERLRG